VIRRDGKGKNFADNAYRNTAQFAFYAIPAKYGKAGTKTFVMNEKAELYWKDLGGGQPVEQWPVREGEGWTKTD
jgi:hypothetical protein